MHVFNPNIDYYRNKTAEALVEIIDGNYNRAKELGLSRLDTQWGMWSRQMNLAVRERIEKKEEDYGRLTHVFIYWTLKSQLLEMHYRRRVSAVGFLIKGKIRRRAKEVKKLKNLILYEAFLEPLDLSAVKIVKNVLDK